MQALLMSKGLWGYVSGTVKKEDITDPKALETFHFNSQNASAQIFLNVDEEMESVIVDKLDQVDAAGMWTALEAECLSKKAGA